MKNMHPRKKGPGRRPQRISTARHYMISIGATAQEHRNLPADFSGAKFIRRMLTNSLTLGLLVWYFDSGHFFLGNATQFA